MRMPFNIHLILILLLALALNFTRVTSASTISSIRRYLPEFTEWHVYVVNELTNSTPLFVHCKSKDNDLGTHNLWPGTNFTWGFRENFFQRTLFWCYVRKSDGHAAFKVFWKDVYLFYKCLWRDCIWIAKDDGVYIRDLDQRQDELRHNWEPGL